MKYSATALVVALGFGLSACNGSSPDRDTASGPVIVVPSPSPNPELSNGTGSEPLRARSGIPCRSREARLDAGESFCFDASFNTAHDGTLIDMTVYVPHPDALAAASAATLAAGELGFAPLIIHGHGFGGAKNGDFEDGTGHFVDNQVAIQALDAGYFVISFSERGFGMSGGQIGLMSPNLEGQDINELLDWAIKHLRGASSAEAADSIYDFNFSSADPEHVSSVGSAADSRPSLLMNDQQLRLLPNDAGIAGNPAVGTIGYSYGGGFQYTGSNADTNDVSPREERERFDALIPEGTWHDLRYSLNANDVPKGYWATLLFGFALNGGTAENGSAPPQFLIDVYTQAAIAGTVSVENQNVLGANGTSAYCDPVSGVTTSADVFHIQGVRDTLFDFNEGLDNALCFARAGNDARYLAVSGGHPLTITQQEIYTGQRTSMDIDEIVHCDVDGDGDQERLSVRELMFRWFEEKLRGQVGAADVIPTVCIAQENTDPADFLSDPNYSQSNASFGYLKEGVTYASLDDVLVGAGAAPTYGCMADANTASCPLNTTINLGGGPEVSQTIFVPLVTIAETRVMAGIPTVDFTLSSLTDEVNGVPVELPVANTQFFVLVGTGLARGGAAAVVLHDQLTPIRNTDRYPYTDTRGVVNENGDPLHYGCGMDADVLCDRGRLVGVTQRLLPGDQIGLIFKSADVQYSQLSNVPNQLTITGDVQFPILGPSALPEANHPDS